MRSDSTGNSRRARPLVGAVAGLGLLVGSASWTRPARGDATAEAMFDQGLADMKAGQFEVGCRRLEESQRLEPLLGTLFTLAECRSRQGKLATALGLYGDFLIRFERLPATERTRQQRRADHATQQREALRERVPQLTLALAPAAPAVRRLRRDGVEFSAALLGVATPIDPGEHEVEAQFEDDRQQTLRFSLAEGERRRVELAPTTPASSASASASASVGASASSAPPPPPSAARPTPPGDSPVTAPVDPTRGRVLVGALTVTALGAALGATFGLLAWREKKQVDDECDGRDCSAAGLASSSSMATYGRLSDVSFGVALAGGLTAGAVAWLWPTHRATPQLSVGPQTWRVGVGVTW